MVRRTSSRPTGSGCAPVSLVTTARIVATRRAHSPLILPLLIHILFVALVCATTASADVSGSGFWDVPTTQAESALRAAGAFAAPFPHYFKAFDLADPDLRRGVGPAELAAYTAAGGFSLSEAVALCRRGPALLSRRHRRIAAMTASIAPVLQLLPGALANMAIASAMNATAAARAFYADTTANHSSTVEHKLGGARPYFWVGGELSFVLQSDLWLVPSARFDQFNTYAFFPTNPPAATPTAALDAAARPHTSGPSPTAATSWRRAATSRPALPRPYALGSALDIATGQTPAITFGNTTHSPAALERFNVTARANVTDPLSGAFYAYPQNVRLSGFVCAFTDRSGTVSPSQTREFHVCAAYGVACDRRVLAANEAILRASGYLGYFFGDHQDSSHPAGGGASTAPGTTSAVTATSTPSPQGTATPPSAAFYCSPVSVTASNPPQAQQPPPVAGPSTAAPEAPVATEPASPYYVCPRQRSGGTDAAFCPPANRLLPRIALLDDLTKDGTGQPLYRQQPFLRPSLGILFWSRALFPSAPTVYFDIVRRSVTVACNIKELPAEACARTQVSLTSDADAPLSQQLVFNVHTQRPLGVFPRGLMNTFAFPNGTASPRINTSYPDEGLYFVSDAAYAQFLLEGLFAAVRITLESTPRCPTTLVAPNITLYFEMEMVPPAPAPPTPQNGNTVGNPVLTRDTERLATATQVFAVTAAIPGVALQLGMLSAVVTTGTCHAPTLVDAMPRAHAPLRMAVGPAKGQYLRGALAGNVVVVAAFIAALAVVAAVVVRPIRRALGMSVDATAVRDALAVPSILVVPVAVVLVGTLSAVMALLTAPGGSSGLVSDDDAALLTALRKVNGSFAVGAATTAGALQALTLRIAEAQAEGVAFDSGRTVDRLLAVLALFAVAAYIGHVWWVLLRPPPLCLWDTALVQASDAVIARLRARFLPTAPLGTYLGPEQKGGAGADKTSPPRVAGAYPQPSFIASFGQRSSTLLASVFDAALTESNSSAGTSGTATPQPPPPRWAAALRWLFDCRVAWGPSVTSVFAAAFPEGGRELKGVLVHNPSPLLPPTGTTPSDLDPTSKGTHRYYRPSPTLGSFYVDDDDENVVSHTSGADGAVASTAMAFAGPAPGAGSRARSSTKSSTALNVTSSPSDKKNASVVAAAAAAVVISDSMYRAQTLVQALEEAFGDARRQQQLWADQQRPLRWIHRYGLYFAHHRVMWFTALELTAAAIAGAVDGIQAYSPNACFARAWILVGMTLTLATVAWRLRVGLAAGHQCLVITVYALISLVGALALAAAAFSSAVPEPSADLTLMPQLAAANATTMLSYDATQQAWIFTTLRRVSSAAASGSGGAAAANVAVENTPANTDTRRQIVNAMTALAVVATLACILRIVYEALYFAYLHRRSLSQLRLLAVATIGRWTRRRTPSSRRPPPSPPYSTALEQELLPRSPTAAMETSQRSPHAAPARDPLPTPPPTPSPAELRSPSATPRAPTLVTARMHEPLDHIEFLKLYHRYVPADPKDDTSPNNHGNSNSNGGGAEKGSTTASVAITASTASSVTL